jgi:hypothetical protein
VLAWVAPALAQRAPRIGFVYPAGGQQGTTFEVTLGGQYLSGVCDVFFSGKGIEGRVLSHERPLSGKETQLLRDKLSKLRDTQKAEKGSASPEAIAATDAEIATLAEKLANFGNNNQQLSAAIGERVKIEVRMTIDALLGDQEIRLGTPNGLTNPLVFRVGQLAEVSEPGAKRAPESRTASRYGRKDAEPPAKEERPAVKLPAVINGQIMPGEVDRIPFTARRGQRVLVSVSARRLIPYLPDAVPGWFQAALTIRDTDGRELAFADDFRFDPDPVLCYAFPKDGEYVIEVRDAIYRGREDFVYRITVGELPFVTGIFPLGGEAGKPCTVQLRGWNLPAGALALNLKGTEPGVLPLVTAREQKISNFTPFAVDALPETLDQEPNNAASKAQPITAPVIVNGRIDAPGDTDVFRITGRPGVEIVAEIHARRLNSALDSVLTLTDAVGQPIATNDDYEDKGAGLTTHHADSRLTAKFPADGVAILHLSDAQHAGSPEHSYRLRVSEPRPDFALRVVPSSVSGRAGSKATITVHALRRDGFAGEIDLALKNAPPGFKLTGGLVPGDKDQATFTLTLPDSLEDPAPIELEGRAQFGEREITRRAVPADDMQQAFAYHHLVPTKQLLAWVPARFGSSARLLTATPVKIPAGGSARVQVAAPLGDHATLELSDPPLGIAMKTVSLTAAGAEIEFTANSDRVIAGENGSLSVHVFTTRKTPGTRARRVSLGPLPTIAFEIVETGAASAQNAQR